MTDLHLESVRLASGEKSATLPAGEDITRVSKAGSMGGRQTSLGRQLSGAMGGRQTSLGRQLSAHSVGRTSLARRSDMAIELGQPSFVSGGGPAITVEELADQGYAWYHPLMLFAWLATWLLPGLGMFTESYYIFSTGQIKNLWKAGYPVCWAHPGKATCPELVTCRGWYTNTPSWINETSCVFASCASDCSYPSEDLCDEALINAVSYIEFAGIMTGMATVGFVAVKLGLRWTSVMTIAVMFVGAILMTASSGNGYSAMFEMFAGAFFVFGYGVGGEYPTAACGATEKYAERLAEERAAKELAEQHGGQAMQEETLEPQDSKRGAAVQMMFSMQGWGAVVGSCVICATIAGFGQASPQCSPGYVPTGYSESDLTATWRIVYGIGFLWISYTLFFRGFKEKEPKGRAEMIAALKEAEKNDPNYMPTHKKFLLFLRVYWGRILGCAGGWLLWDIVFYGNKLFSGPIFAAILGSGTHLLGQNEYILLNNSVALVGYWFSAFTIDKPWMGRLRLQCMGMAMVGILFMFCAIFWDTLTANNSDALLALYLLTSFFGQFGPNATTYVLPSESFPAEVRTYGHGLSAFAGKAGALAATIWFSNLNGPNATKTIFWICFIACAIGLVVTVIFCNNLSHCELESGDERWAMIKAGKGKEYHGEAVRFMNLSWFEILILRLHKQYKPHDVVEVKEASP